MFVTDFQIVDYRYCPDRARHLANVCLTLKDRMVTLLCALDLPAETGAPSRASAFLNDAIRQMRRMPELRSGKARLEIAEGLVDAETQAA